LKNKITRNKRFASERALLTLKHMNVEFQRLELKNDIQSKVQHDMSQQQREYFLATANKNYSRGVRRCKL